MRRRPLDPADRFEGAAESLDEVTGLLRAGVALDALPAFATAGVAELLGVADGSPDGRMREVVRTPVESDLVGAVLTVCRVSGAPLVPALQRQARVLRLLAQASRDVEVAAVGPRATSRIVSSLPLAGIVVATLLGFDVTGALFRSPLGGTFAVVGLVLTFAGATWSRRIVASARPPLAEPGLLHELTGVALGGGLALGVALDLARSAALPVASLLAASEAPHTAAPPRPAAARGSAPPSRRAVSRSHRGRDSSGLSSTALDDAARDVEDAVSLAHRSGAALVPLLLARADLRRRRHAVSARARIERLGTALLAPLGLCSLPAFLLLGVGPALLAVVSSTVR